MKKLSRNMFKKLRLKKIGYLIREGWVSRMRRRLVFARALWDLSSTPLGSMAAFTPGRKYN